MNSMAKIEGLIFDMDGLLFDTEKLYCRANIAAAKQFDLDYDEDYYQKFIGISDQETLEIYQADFPHLSKSKLEEFIALGHEKVEKLFLAGEAEVKPGVEALLNYLKKQEIPAIVASSNLPNLIDLLLEKANLTDYFVGKVSSADVKRAKPDPEIVEKAVDRLALAPENCLMLEDSLNGIRASHQAEVPVIMVPDLIIPNDEMKAKSLAIMSDLFEVKEFLKKQ